MRLRIESRPIMGVFVVHWGKREVARLPDILTGWFVILAIISVCAWIYQVSQP